jgi:hypothetical protein
MFQEGMPIFWEVIVSVILSKKVYMYMCHIPNSFTVQTSNTPCPHRSCKVHWCWRWNFRKCIILGKLYQLCHLNNKYRYWKQYVTSSNQQLWSCTVKFSLSRKRFGIEDDIYIYIFWLRMTHTMTSQNTDLSSWDILYIAEIMKA